MAGSVLIVQHAEKRRLSGDPGLTEVGYRQAEAVAAFLAPRPEISAVYSSPLRRARETAGPTAEGLKLEVRIDDRLRERMNWGGPATQTIEAFLQEWIRASRDRDYQPRSGNSSRAAGQRFRALLDELPHGETIVVVS